MDSSSHAWFALSLIGQGGSGDVSLDIKKHGYRKEQKLMEQNVIVDSKWGRIKVQFEHCPSCPHFESCYDEGRGPNFITETCADEDNFPQHYKGTDDYSTL